MSDFKVGDTVVNTDTDFTGVIVELRDNGMAVVSFPGRSLNKYLREVHVSKLKLDSSAIYHPFHYNSGSIEAIDYIEDHKLGFHLGNSIKYITRAGKKSKETEQEDIEKAIWYLQRYIDDVINE